MLHLLLLVFSFANLESFVNGQVGLIPPVTKPSKFAYSPGCYLKDYDVMIPYTENFSPQDGRTCAKFSCGYDGYIKITTCLKSYGKNCKFIPADRKLTYPKCCDKMVCRKDFNTPNNSEIFANEDRKDDSNKTTITNENSKAKINKEVKSPSKSQIVANVDLKDNLTEVSNVPLEQENLNKTESKVLENKPRVQENSQNTELNKQDQIDEEETLTEESKIEDKKTDIPPKETRNSKSISPDALELGKKDDEEKQKGFETVSENQSQNNEKQNKDDDSDKNNPVSKKNSLTEGEPISDSSHEGISDSTNITSKSKDAEVVDKPVSNKDIEFDQNQKPDNDNKEEIVTSKNDIKNGTESSNDNPILNKTLNVEKSSTFENLNKDGTESLNVDKIATNDELSNLNTQIESESESENSNKEDTVFSKNNDSPNNKPTSEQETRLEETFNLVNGDKGGIVTTEAKNDNHLTPDTPIKEQANTEKADLKEPVESNPKDEQVILDEDNKKVDENNFPESTDTKSDGKSENGDSNIENESKRETTFSNDGDKPEEASESEKAI